MDLKDMIFAPETAFQTSDKEVKSEHGYESSKIVQNLHFWLLAKFKVNELCERIQRIQDERTQRIKANQVNVLLERIKRIEDELDELMQRMRAHQSEERCLTESSENIWRSLKELCRSEERCLTEYSENMRRSLKELCRSEERCLKENSENMRSREELYRIIVKNRQLTSTTFILPSTERCLTENSSGMWRSWGGLYQGSGIWIIQQPRYLKNLSKGEMYMLLQSTPKASMYQCFLEKDTSLCDNETPIENSDERKLELLKAKNKELDKEMKEKLQRCIHRLNGMRIRKPMQKRQLATI